MKVVTIQDKVTGVTDIAIYAANNKGNMQYNVDGIFYTDINFDKKFDIIPTEQNRGVTLGCNNNDDY